MTSAQCAVKYIKHTAARRPYAILDTVRQASGGCPTLCKNLIDRNITKNNGRLATAASNNFGNCIHSVDFQTVLITCDFDLLKG